MAIIAPYFQEPKPGNSKFHDNPFVSKGGENEVKIWNSDVNIYFICIPAFAGVTYYAALEGGLYKTTDEGLNWFLASNQVVSHLVTGKYGDTYYLFSASNCNILRSKDYGATFESIPLPESTGWVSTIVCNPVHPETVYAALTKWPPALSKLYISPDSGTSWSLLYMFPVDYGIHKIAISKTQPNIMFASASVITPGGACFACVWRSTNAGISWKKVLQLYDPWTLGRDIEIDPWNEQIVYFSQDVNVSGVWKSIDCGASWNKIFDYVSPGPIEIDPEWSNNIYVGITENGISGYLYKSTDYGHNWTNISPHSDLFPREIIADPTCPQVIFTLGYEWIVPNRVPKFYRSINRGELWDLRVNGLPSSSQLYALAPSPLLESEHSRATAYQSLKFNYNRQLNRFFLVYSRSSHIFTNYSQDNGHSWREGKILGTGEFPTISPDANGYPCAIWQRNVEPTPMMGGGELWFSRYDGTNWSEPYLLGSFTGPYYLDVNLPSFTIVPATNRGYVVFEWRDRFINGPNSHLYLGWFSINNPSDIQFTELEYAPNPERCEFPSITQLGNYLYIAFQREHKIFRIKWDMVSQQIVDRDQVSEDGKFSHHPYCDAQAHGVINYVWEDSTTTNIDIYRRYEWNTNWSDIRPVVLTPGKSQWPQICKGTTWITWSEFIYPPTDHNWEICYKDMEYDGYQILSQTFEISKYSHGVVYRSPYWPPPYEPKLTAIWTEGHESPYEIRVKTVTLPEISYFYVDAGREEPSPWTIQREGYIQFAPEPEKTIDYHSTKLIYHFPNLNPAKRYRIKLVFYFESQGQNRWKMKIDGDNIFHANIWLNPGKVTTLERWLPTACYKDGELWLNITKIIGDYALVAQIFIYEYEREIEEITKNTQESGSLPANEPGIFIRPNPVHSIATITYLHPIDNQTPATLKIYDASGRLVKSFSHLTNVPLNQITWNGTDETGKIMSNGVYFVVLETDKGSLAEKLILLR